MKTTIAQIILNLYRDAYKTGPFITFRQGDPIMFGQSQLPALVITESNTKYEEGPTGFDLVTHNLTIQVVFNKKDDFGSKSVDSSIDKRMDDIVQGRDETTNELLPNTILGILRKQISLNGAALSNDVTVKNGIITRPDGLITAEVHIDITIEENLQVSNRF